VRVTIITAVINNKIYIEACMKSLLNQTHRNIEYIIIDGGSADGTIEIIKKYENKVTKWISEPDNGIYDALNKGIRLAQGEIIGFLHADDVYANDKVIEKVADIFTKYNVDSCYGDLLYVDKNNPEKIIRYWKSNPYKEGLFRKGWMPPHPTFFVKRKIYEKYGSFNTDFKIAADYELMLRFLGKYKISTYYIPEVLIKMRIGGASNRSLRNLIIKTTEDYRAWKVNSLNKSLYTIPLKNLSKIPQFFKKSV
jgi:glycosyltransferase involved in cell wall biosynthesis